MLTPIILWSAVALLTKLVYARPGGLTPRAEASTFNFATIGDSWASGVTYGIFGWTNYDDNSSGCMRLKDAYGPQLFDDWPQDLGAANFTFAACSGAKLVDIVRGRHQMDLLPADTHFVTMQAGGNDAGFYALARDCIFHNEVQDYGSEYPQPGVCSETIQNVEDFVSAEPTAVEGTWRFTDDTIRELLTHPSAQGDDFKLYVLGYAHLFNDDSPDSDWCNDISFSVSLSEFSQGKRVKLTQSLRAKINDLTTQLNNQIQDVIRNLDNSKVVYISITEGFTGHRFCEAGSTYFKQYFDPDVWFWNVSPAFLENVYTTDPTELTANLDAQAALDNDWDLAYNTEFPLVTNIEAYNWTDLLQMEKGPTAQSPHQGESPGSALRPLHPKSNGHWAIKEAIRAQILTDF